MIHNVVFIACLCVKMSMIYKVRALLYQSAPLVIPFSNHHRVHTCLGRVVRDRLGWLTGPSSFRGWSRRSSPGAGRTRGRVSCGSHSVDRRPCSRRRGRKPPRHRRGSWRRAPTAHPGSTSSWPSSQAGDLGREPLWSSSPGATWGSRGSGLASPRCSGLFRNHHLNDWLRVRPNGQVWDFLKYDWVRMTPEQAPSVPLSNPSGLIVGMSVMSVLANSLATLVTRGLKINRWEAMETSKGRSTPCLFWRTNKWKSELWDSVCR